MCMKKIKNILQTLNLFGKNMQTIWFDDIPEGHQPFTLTITWQGDWIEAGYTAKMIKGLHPKVTILHKQIKQLFNEQGTSTLDVNRSGTGIITSVQDNKIYFRCCNVTYLKVDNGEEEYVLIDNE